MKNRNGFTLIEVIGAVIILGIIAIFAVVTYTSSLKGFKESYYVETERTLQQSGKEFFNNYRNYRPDVVLGAQKVLVKTLVGENYISSIKDYDGNLCDLEISYVLIVKEGRNHYSYHTCLVCSVGGYDGTSSSYCDPSWLDSNQISYTLGDLSPIYIYKGTDRNELKNKLLLSVTAIRTNYAGVEIGRIDDADSDEIPKILPSNIDIIDVDKLGEYEVSYEYDGKISTRKVIIYENNAPGVSISYKNVVANGSIAQMASDNPPTTTETVAYNTDKWGQKAVISLTSQNAGGTEIEKFQWYKGGRWIDLCSATNNSCTATVNSDMNEEVQFRSVDKEGKISKVGNSYLIKIDATKPACALRKTGDENDIAWQMSQNKVEFNSSLTTDQSMGVAAAISGITSSNIIKQELENVQREEYIGFVEDGAKNFNTCSITIPKAEIVTITYNNNGGSGCNTKNVLKNSNFGTLCIPVRTDYVFQGWWTLSSGGVRVTESDIVTGDTTIYAHWEVAAPNVTGGNYEDLGDGKWQIEFTGDGEFTIPVSGYYDLYLLGGGQGGSNACSSGWGGSDATIKGGGAGGQGGYVFKGIVYMESGTYNVTIGAGGAAGNPGAQGGTTSIKTISGTVIKQAPGGGSGATGYLGGALGGTAGNVHGNTTPYSGGDAENATIADFNGIIRGGGGGGGGGYWCNRYGENCSSSGNGKNGAGWKCTSTAAEERKSPAPANCGGGGYGNRSCGAGGQGGSGYALIRNSKYTSPPNMEVTAAGNYTITYVCTGGNNNTGTINVTNGSLTTMPFNVCGTKIIEGGSSNDGGIFYQSSWSTTNDGDAVPSYTVTGNVTVYSVWTNNFGYDSNYNVINDGNGNWSISLLNTGYMNVHVPVAVDLYLLGGGQGGQKPGNSASGAYHETVYYDGGAGGQGGFVKIYSNSNLASGLYSVAIGAGGARNSGTGGTTIIKNANDVVLYQAPGGGSGATGYSGGASGGARGDAEAGIGGGNGTNSSVADFYGIYRGGGGAGGYSAKELWTGSASTYNGGTAGTVGGGNSCENATANTGGGGGGGCGAHSDSAGIGGSGIVIIRNTR